MQVSEFSKSRSALSGRTVLITGARAPVALHMARLMHEAGYRAILADSLGIPLSRNSAACAAYLKLPSPRFELERFAESLRQAVSRHQISLVIPTCEEVFYLAKVWRDDPPQAELFAPDFELLARCHNKYEFIRLAGSFGLEVPDTTLISGKPEIAKFTQQSRDHVFKKVWSRFASSVLIRPANAELATINPTPDDPWIAQRYVDGEEISVYALAREGKLLGLSLYRSLYRAGKGAGVCFENMEDKNCEAFVRTFLSKTGWTGQISFDLMREPSGRILPLECNPRATSGLHFFMRGDAFADALAGSGNSVMPDSIGVQGVRLATLLYGFPKAVTAGKLAVFMATVRNMKDIMDWPSDRITAGMQIRSLAEIAGIALKHRISLQSASTRDIEWNGAL